MYVIPMIVHLCQDQGETFEIVETVGGVQFSSQASFFEIKVRNQIIKIY